MIDYQLAVLIAILSYTYTNLLTEPEMIFNGLYKACDKYMPRWLFYPFIHCEKCNSAWIAIIIFTYQYYIGFIIYPLQTIGHLFLFISFTVYTTYTIKQINEKLWQK